MMIEDKNKRSITLTYSGFNIISPISETKCFIKWKNIETIIFSPSSIYENAAQWIIYLNESPQWSLKLNAWWLNKLSFSLKDKKYKKVRIRDNSNKDFYKFPNLVEEHLGKKQEINYSDNNRKGELISKKVIVKDNKTITKEYWIPKRSNEMFWKILYDRHGRTVEQIYERDGAI